MYFCTRVSLIFEIRLGFAQNTIASCFVRYSMEWMTWNVNKLPFLFLKGKKSQQIRNTKWEKKNPDNWTAQFQNELLFHLRLLFMLLYSTGLGTLHHIFSECVIGKEGAISNATHLTTNVIELLITHHTLITSNYILRWCIT